MYVRLINMLRILSQMTQLFFNIGSLHFLLNIDLVHQIFIIQ